MPRNRARIAALNDTLRTAGEGGQVVMTSGIQAKGDAFVQQTIAAVRTFSSFSRDNDPYGEHDFGNLEIGGEQVMSKIDYYNKEMDGGSEDPADPDQTVRVLTIMLAREY